MNVLYYNYFSETTIGVNGHFTHSADMEQRLSLTWWTTCSSRQAIAK